MHVYTTKLAVTLSLREVREVFDDPFKFAGVSGHINLLMGLRPQDEEPFFFDQADSPPTRFRALFLLETPKGQTVTYFGTFEKVLLPSFDMISYKGVEDHHRFEFQIDISLKETASHGTTVTLSAVSNFKVDFLSRLTGKAPSYYIGQHIFEQHFIPYLRWAEAAKRSQDIVRPTSVFEILDEQTVVSSILKAEDRVTLRAYEI